MGCCSNFCGLLVLVIAVGVGYLQTFEYPWGIVFRVMFTIQGYGKPMTQPVPMDQPIAPRPSEELFLPLPSGAKMPANGIGMCCRPTAYDEESVYNTILWYLLSGGRHIDTAAVYGNHVPIGKALKEAAKRGIPRSEVFLVTKVWPANYGYDGTMAAAGRMLKQLDVDYIDLVLLHAPRMISWRMVAAWWGGMNWLIGDGDEFSHMPCEDQVTCRKATWKALSELREQGLIRDVGVSNFRVPQMKELQGLGMAPIAANQIQFHPWIPDFQQEIVDFCNANRIVITAYFSLGGLQSKDKTLQLDDIKAIGKKHSRSSGQVLLRWALAKNVSIIPGTGNPKHMKENLGIYDFSLSPDEVSRIDALRSHPIADDFFFMQF
ncbi:P100/11E [Symbiodinium natans]|uniref:P100/11E protein n=1 Tax=Symbiodinium natans TaxID=878477 RepID=A0A812ST21_9DINO|nr:P100/11E [Symbiodinium natans]